MKGGRHSRALEEPPLPVGSTPCSSLITSQNLAPICRENGPGRRRSGEVRVTSQRAVADEPTHLVAALASPAIKGERGEGGAKQVWGWPSRHPGRQESNGQHPKIPLLEL